MMSKTTNENVFVIGSGKGGVGKSTLAVNLAIALSQRGMKIALLDADIYGPSIPTMLGLRRLSPPIIKGPDGHNHIQPFTKFGIQILSIGFFLEEARSALWRGPVVHSALQKMLTDVEWGEIDLLLIDLPPGTGDVLISLSQLLTITGSIIITTPQEVAVVDAAKMIHALQQLDIPLNGLIENMAGFTCPNTHQTYSLFGSSRGQSLADRFGLCFLGSIPFIPAIREGGDEGKPYSSQLNPTTSFSFDQIAETFCKLVLFSNSNPFLLP